VTLRVSVIKSVIQRLWINPIPARAGWMPRGNKNAVKAIVARENKMKRTARTGAANGFACIRIEFNITIEKRNSLGRLDKQRDDPGADGKAESRQSFHSVP
jgi:hypothetical protein